MSQVFGNHIQLIYPILGFSCSLISVLASAPKSPTSVEPYSVPLWFHLSAKLQGFPDLTKVFQAENKTLLTRSSLLLVTPFFPFKCQIIPNISFMTAPSLVKYFVRAFNPIAWLGKGLNLYLLTLHGS